MKWWPGILCYLATGTPLSTDECRVSRQLVALAQSCLSLRADGHRELQRLNEATSELSDTLWTRLVLRLEEGTLCADALVAGSVFGHLAELIFQELVDWGWIDRVSLTSHQDENYLEWQVSYLSLLGIVERMATFSLQINGLHQEPIRSIQALASQHRCQPHFQVPSTKEVGFMGCLSSFDTAWKPDERSLTLPDRLGGSSPEVDRVLNETDEIYKAQHVVIYFPSTLVPSMRMMAVLPHFAVAYKGVTCDKKVELFPFGAGMTNGDVEIFQRLGQLPSLQVQKIFGIGNAFGYSTTIFTKLWPSAAVDVLDAEVEGACAPVGSAVTRRIAQQLEADVKLHIGFSPGDVPLAMRFQSYELVFIDGQHTVEQLILDFEAVRPYLAERTVVVLHDIEFSFLHTGVKWLLASPAGSGFRYYRGKTVAYRNLLGTGLLVRNLSPKEMALVGEQGRLGRGLRPPEVVIFMREIGLSQYSDVLLRHGFDDLEILMDVQDSHLKAMGFLPGHMLKIKKRLKEHKTSLPAAGNGFHDPSTIFTSSTSSLSVPSARGAPSSTIIDAVSQSWPLVEGRVLEIAESLYKNLFVLAPDTRKLFPLSVRNRYRDWSSPIDEVENELEKSTALPLIWSKVIYAVGSSVSGLRNPSKLVLDLNALGMRHAGYKVKEEHFALVGEALIMALRTHVDGLSHDTEQAWMTVYEFIANATKAGIQSVHFQKRALKETQRPATLLKSNRRASGISGFQPEPDKKFAPMSRSINEVKVKSKSAAAAPSPSPSGILPSQRAILTVQQSWVAVKDLGIANVGEILYKHLFRIAPVTKKLFPLSVRMRYRDWTTSAEEVEDDFDNSPALRNLFAKVVEAVGTAVAGLHNISRLVFELNALGMRHINYNMQEEYFEFGGQALVLTLQDGLGPALSDEIKQAWISVYEFISANIISGLRFAREKENLLKKLQLDSHKAGSSWSTTAASAASGGSAASDASFDDVC